MSPVGASPAEGESPTARFGGKRFLLTHTIVQNIMGSTLVILELAEYLKSQGASVLVYAACSGAPVKAWFDEAGIEVTTDDSTLRLADFDYVWINSQVLPVGFIEELAEGVPAQMPALIFAHLSALPAAPDEHPYLYGLEENLASLSVFVAARTRELLLPFFNEPPPTAQFPNPVPMEFCRAERVHAKRPRRFLFVSNHATRELEQVRELLRERGYQVLHCGRGGDRYERVSPELLAEFDVVVTIGKTVQYCLVSETPVFVYDHFGGFGYLTADNFGAAAWANFSGRGGDRYDAEMIVEMLFDGYPGAVSFQASNRDDFVRRYSIDIVLPELLDGLRRRELQPLGRPLANASISAQRFGARFYRFWGHRLRSDAELERLRRENQGLRDQIDKILRSRSFRLGYSLLKPLMPIVNRR